MPSSSTWKLPALAATGILAVAGTLAISRARPGCCLRMLPKDQNNTTTTPTSGEKYMPTRQPKTQVQHANETNFRDLVLHSKMPVLVDFYADWCAPCQRLAPVLDELAAELPAARIVKVNVDHDPNLAEEFGVDSIPSLKVFRNGHVTDQLVGLASKSELRAMLVR